MGQPFMLLCLCTEDAVDMRKNYPVIDVAATGRNIKRIMERRNISVREMQEFLHLSAPQSIYHWLNGSCMPTIDNLYALSQLFKVPLDNIVIGNRKMHKGISTEYRALIYYEAFQTLIAS